MTYRRSDAPSRRRHYWRAARRLYRLLWWQAFAAVRLGLVRRSGAVSRWLGRQCAELEHGLMALLVIRLTAPGKAPGQPGATTASGRTNTHVSGAGPEATDNFHELAGLEEPDAARPARARFSLSLDAIWPFMPDHARDQVDAQKPARGLPPRRSKAEAQSVQRRARDPSHQLERRIAAMAAVISDPEAHAARLAHRLAGFGLYIKKAATARPDPDGRVALALAAMQTSASAPRPAICDSS